ncbi:hypothetical protein FJ976_17275 [Mesorhizobium sp. B1-1-9]|uniref:hypothetical protein n=1 Tax=Mesorhizobium sp. B1-1-9 TaxID=2589975 RepID=UPI00112D478A|nr:hypothetical protein [Mesorhizobium sp. B1-1-9]TPN49481.1 hypothetical protein FJ976_17275 [Mesorhizobium sp. B1-1-9]
MKPYEIVVHENYGEPGNSHIVTLFFDPALGEFKVREFVTRYKGTRTSKGTRSISSFLKLKDQRWPNQYTLAQMKLRKKLVELMIKGGAELVDDITAHRPSA